jgi:tetratricopeptide (TPR) repeat protein
VAEELARLADADRHRLGYAAASAALERACDITPDPDLAARRLALAAHDAFLAGDIARVRVLVGRVLAGSAPDRARGEALFTLGMLEQYAGSVPRSVEHLDDASSLLGGPALVRALTELAVARFRLNDIAGLVECAQQIDAVADRDDPEQQLLADFTGGAALVLTGHFDAGGPRLAEVRRLANLRSLRHDARALLLMALAAAFTGQVGDAVTVGAARIAEVRRRGAIGVLVPVLALLAAGRAWLGDHAGAFADAGEAAELAAHLGYAADGSVAVEMLAWQLSARGLHDEARDSLVRARMLTDRAGTTSAARISRRCWSRPTSVSGGGTVHAHSPPATPWPRLQQPHRSRSRSCADARPSRPTARPVPGRHSTRRWRRRPRRLTLSRRRVPDCSTAAASDGPGSESPHASSSARHAMPSTRWSSRTGPRSRLRSSPRPGPRSDAGRLLATCR